MSFFTLRFNPFVLIVVDYWAAASATTHGFSIAKALSYCVSVCPPALYFRPPSVVSHFILTSSACLSFPLHFAQALYKSIAV